MVLREFHGYPIDRAGVLPDSLAGVSRKQTEQADGL